MSTIPWDSYLIRANIWSYPPDAILGPTLFSIPAEELFFFVIQTYITSLVYLCLNKANFAPALLPYEHGPEDNRTRGRWGWQQRHETLVKVIGQLALICAIIAGAALIKSGGAGTYLGLIICWAFPFLLLLWYLNLHSLPPSGHVADGFRSLSSQFMLRLPAFSIIGPIAIPTFYLWLVDSLALRRGTWVIVQGTKYNVQLFGSLDIESVESVRLIRLTQSLANDPLIGRLFSLRSRTRLSFLGLPPLTTLWRFNTPFPHCLDSTKLRF